MPRPQTLVITSHGDPYASDPTVQVVPPAQILDWCRTGAILRHAFRYRQARLVAPHLQTMPEPLLKALLLRYLSHGTCAFVDEHGAELRLSLLRIAGLFRDWAWDLISLRAVLRRVREDAAAMEAPAPEPPGRSANLTLTPAYLRTDLLFGLQSGGSVGHIAGVLNHLDCFCGAPLFLAADRIPTVRSDIETHIILPESRFRDFAEIPALRFNQTFHEAAQRLLSGQHLGFIYQRYCLGNFAGARLARKFRVPFVLEYNGPEVWVAQHWGRRLRYEALAGRIEQLNLDAATLVVVVSRPLLDELTARGVDAHKILVNPNGVDPDRYSPSIDGAQVRGRLNLAGKTVIGFIGTFGKWHGAEILADAFARLVQANPQCRETVRLLMIGDGVTLPLVRDIVSRYGLNEVCVFTGTVPQEQGPEYLAACDILVSPQVPNADGTPFFGSPTKLFEYMAMGKGIVASDLDQIGEVIEHDRTGWLVKPGDAEALADGLQTLVDSAELRSCLGAAARQRVLERHTWREHTRRIIDRLAELCPERSRLAPDPPSPSKPSPGPER